MKLSINKRILQGKITAAGFLFESALIPERKMQERILSYWHPDASLFKVPFGRLLLLPHPVQVYAHSSPGTPLCKTGNILFSFIPLEQKKVTGLPDSTVCIIRNNQPLLIITDTIAPITPGAYPVLRAEPEDPAHWFTAPDIALLIPGFPEQEKPSGLPRQLLQDAPKDVRKQLGQKPADTEMLAVLEAIKQKARVKDEAGIISVYPARGKGSRRPSGLAASLIKTAAILAINASNLLSYLINSNSPASTKKTAPQSQRPPAPQGTPSKKGPGLWDKFQEFIKTMLVQSQLWNHLGARQSRFFKDLIDDFEQGNILEALHKAVPLSKDVAGSLSQLNLGVPQRRSTLGINYGPQGKGSSSFFMEQDFFSYLKELYRKSFNQLAAQEKIEEAAFVLAELLQEHAEAVSFLENKGLLEKAAELAEARNLPPALCIRQWLLGGNKTRAVDIALFRDCFSEAVFKLEKSTLENDRNLARELRTAWAGEKARGGLYNLAASIISTVPEQRGLMQEYLLLALKDEGIEKIKAVSALLKHFPDTQEAFDLARMLLESGEENRNLLLDELSGNTVIADNSRARALGRYGLRICLEESGQASLPRSFKQLLTDTGELALLEDYHRCEKKQQTSIKPEFYREDIVITFTDRGSIPLYEAVLLPAGRLLVALGEAGAVIVNKQGTIKQHYDEPAYKIIMADSGNRAILAAPRGETYRLSRLDLNQKKCSYWTDARISTMADTYNGSVWAAFSHKELIMIDVRSDDFGYLWHSGDLQGEVTRIGRCEKSITCIIQQPVGESSIEIEHFTYSLPTLFLDKRASTTVSPAGAEGIILLDTGRTALVRQTQPQEEKEGCAVLLKTEGLKNAGIDRNTLSDAGSLYLPLFIPGAVLIGKTASATHIGLSLSTEGGIWIVVLDLAGMVQKRILLEGAGQVYSKLTEDRMIICDNLGRIIIYNIHTGRAENNHRIQL